MTARTSLSLAALLGLASLAAAGAPAPQHKTLRPLSMGNAFVAVVDNKDALYYNPAGLNLINRLGNPVRRPALAKYPRNRFDARVNALGMAAPVQEYRPFWDFYDAHQDAFGSVDDAKQDSTLLADLAPLDGKALALNYMAGIEFAMNNYGGAYWANAQVAPVIHANPLFPTPGVRDITVDQVIQVAASHSFQREKLAVGVGYRLVNRQEIRELEISSELMASDSGQEQIRNDLKDSALAKMRNLSDLGSYGHGFDVGALYQYRPWLRFGGAVQNLGLYLNHSLVTPKVTVGVAITPPLLSSGGIFARKVNIAVDYEDLLNDERNYKAFSKLNFGAEIEQYGWRFFSVRVAGGFKGGYWTAGGGISLFDFVHLEAASWADEGGYYTGQVEDRLYAFNVGLGF